jgi:hypothetical protein
METNSEHDNYLRIQKKVKGIRAFYDHLCCYFIVMPVLFLVNRHFTPDDNWFPFTAVGWGAGVLLHGLKAFDYIPFLGRDWEERKINALLKKEKKDNQQQGGQSSIKSNNN